MHKILIGMLLFMSLNADSFMDGTSKMLDKKFKEALVYFEQSCNEGNSQGCLMAGLTYSNNIELQDKKKAKKLFEESCAKRNAVACLNLGTMYYDGDGVRQNKQTSKELFEKACDGENSTTCQESEKMCKYGDMHACYNFGLVYFTKQNYKQAKDLFNLSCKLGVKKGCQKYTLAILNLYNNGKSLDPYDYTILAELHIQWKEYSKAKELLEKACDGGIYQSCYKLGGIYYTGDSDNNIEQDKQKAKELLGKACDGGVMDGCHSLGYIYDNGDGAKEDKQKAKKLYKKACDGEYFVSCTNLANLYIYGEGVKKDAQKAKELLGKACDGGVMKGCEGYKILNEAGIK